MPTLNWRGKDAVLNHHLDVPYHLLKCEPELSAGCPGSGNLIVEGDNLLALKAMLPYYKGQVKCIYIDPPYNTGNEGWIYNDNVNSPEMRDWLGKVVGKEAEDLNRHDKWLCMMWPRLKLLKEMLHVEGSFWINLDDNEIHFARMILDELFGPGNFVAHCVWQKKYATANDHKTICPMHDHLLVYQASMAFQRNLLPRTEAKDRQYRLEDAKGVFRPDNYTCNKSADERPNLYYPITNPNTGKEIWPKRTAVWRYSQDRHEDNVANDLVYWGKNGNGNVPAYKRHLTSLKGGGGTVPSTWWTHEEVGHTDEAKKEIRTIFEGHDLSDFITPKPVRLLERILTIATQPGDLVLDSFAGSGTTAHAVMKLNAEDGGDRRFILIEMDPAIARPVTVERVRRVARGYTNAKGEAIPGLGSDFRFCTLGAPLFRGNGSLNEELTRDTLGRHLFFTEFGEPLVANSTGSRTLVGTFGDTALHLLWDANGPGFLDAATLRGLPEWAGEFVVYGEGCAIPSSVLQERRVSFRQIPYRVRG